MVCASNKKKGGVALKRYQHTKTFTYEGVRYKVRADSLEELYVKMAEKKHQLKNNLVVYDSKMLLKDWAEIAISTYKTDISDRALYDIRTRIRKHILPELGNLPIGKIRQVQCQNLINDKKGFSQEYINKICQDLNFLFEKAKQNHMIMENPAEYIIRPKGPATPRRAITAQEREHLFRICDKDDRFLPFLVMLQCGCRPAEALDIVRNDIIQKEGIPFLHIRGTKTVNSDRIVPMPPDLLRRLSMPPGPFDNIFLTMHGKPYTRSAYGALVRALKKAMNLSMGCRTYRNQLLPPFPLAEDFVPYCLRHTYCTDLQKAGVDIRTAQKLMGHADIQTTANIYTHQDDETLLEAARLLRCPAGCPTKMSKNE